MNNKESLEYLRDLTVKKYIKGLEEDDIQFKDMSPIISLLNQNSIVEEKGSSSVEEEISKRVKDAEKRRNEV